MLHTRLYRKIRALGLNQSLLYMVGFMLFFWAIFDGVLGYLVPLVITDAGFSDTQMGIIFGSSSMFGAVFDFLLSKYLSNTHFRRIYFAMLAVCALYPLILWHAKGVWMFVFAMALWGIYYDLENFGNFDFVGRKADTDVHSSHFGILISFKSVGYLLAPLLAGLLIGSTVIGTTPYIFSWVMLGIAFIIFLSIIFLNRKRAKDEVEPKTIKPVNFVKEIFLWRSIGKLLFPVLVLTALLNIIDAFFWTIGPLAAESFVSFHPFNGLLLVAYEIPPLIAGVIVGTITKRFGKKKTAFTALLIGALLLVYMPLLHSFPSIVGMVFLASCFISIAWPSINGAYADYISETVKYEKEIEGIEDFSTNFGYIIGPIIAGFLADTVGNLESFSYLGFGVVIVSILLLKFTPKSIKVKVDPVALAS